MRDPASILRKILFLVRFRHFLTTIGILLFFFLFGIMFILNCEAGLRCELESQQTRVNLYIRLVAKNDRLEKDLIQNQNVLIDLKCRHDKMLKWLPGRLVLGEKESVDIVLE